MLDTNGHDGWNPFAAVSNWWNGLSPTDQFIALTAIAVVAVAATVLTVGALAPVAAEAIGADVSVGVAIDAGEVATADVGPSAIDTAGIGVAANEVSNLASDLGGVTEQATTAASDAGTHFTPNAIGQFGEDAAKQNFPTRYPTAFRLKHQKGQEYLTCGIQPRKPHMR